MTWRALAGLGSSNTRRTETGGQEGEDEEPGSEILGFGLWPSASYWNHSCSPNVRKQRHGRAWRFWADRQVETNEELCISYLGGDEKQMSVGQRRERLKSWWGFDCACRKCEVEEKEEQEAATGVAEFDAQGTLSKLGEL